MAHSVRLGVAGATLAGLLVTACNPPVTPTLVPVSTSVEQAVWVNGDFEADAIGTTPPTGWSLTNYTNNQVSGAATAPPGTFAALNLTTPGTTKNETFVVGGATLAQVDPDLGAGQAFRYPIYGVRTARVNYKDATDNGKNKNVNVIKQTQTVSLADVDPTDGQIHVRFAVAPVLENPSHGYTQQPYFYVELNNLTRGTQLFHGFNTAGEAGVPWHTTTSVATGNATLWLDWQLVDITPGNASLTVGDQVQLTVVGAGCSLGGHFGRIYVDGMGSTVPGPYVSATGPASAPAGTNITYTVTYSNGGTTDALGAHVDMVMPPKTTFVSTSLASCTGGPTGTMTCALGTLPAGASGSFTVTVAIGATATGTVVNGNYSISAVNAPTLLGSKVITTIVGGGATSHSVDLRVTKTAAVNTLDWNTGTYDCPAASRPACTGITPLYTLTVANPSTTVAFRRTPATSCDLGPCTIPPTITDLAPANLTDVYWSCTETTQGTANRSGGSTATRCNDASGAFGAAGTGNMTISPRLGKGSLLTIRVWGKTVTGTGLGTITNTVATTTPGACTWTGGTCSITDPTLTNNTATVVTQIGTPQTLTVSKTGTGTGTVTSSPTGINCGTTCSNTLPAGLTVVLTATPTNGSTFTGWTGCTANPTNPAQCTVTMAGATSVTANFTAAPPVGAATNIYVYGGNNQYARALGTCAPSPACSAFALPLTAFVTDAAGNPKPGVVVTFTVPGSGASATLTTVTATTDASGIASVVATANATMGSYSVSASIPSVVQTALFTLTNVGAPSTITYLSGGNVTDPQLTTVNSAFGTPLMAIVRDALGNPVPGVTVTYTPPGSGAGATLSSATAVSDTSGIVQVTATANGTVGAFTVSANFSGGMSPVVFNLQNVAGTAAAIYVVAGSPQTTSVSTAFVQSLVAVVVDAAGNAVPNVTVTFQAPTTGATATLALGTACGTGCRTVITDAAGLVTVTGTANATGGSYNVTATATGVAIPARFALVNDGGYLLSIQAGSPQGATVSTAFGTPLTVYVEDTATAAAAPNGTVVTFVVPGSGPTATLSSFTATTTGGVASVNATANATAGAYQVSATTPNAPNTVFFQLTNQCTTSTQCGGTTPICDTTSHLCTPCASNAACSAKSAALPFCDVSGSCVGCLTDSNCSGATPICNPVSMVCGACSVDAQCATKNPALPYCDATGNCFTCTLDSQCSGATPACSPATHTCVAAACAPNLSNPANGTVDFTTGVTGDVRNYTCNAGYTRSGAATTTCLSNRTWSNAAPTCVANACAPALTAPTNGTVDVTTGVTGDVRNYACNAGYTRSGSATTTCQANGTWSAAAPTCVANACAPALANPTNGTVDFTTGVTGDTRNYTCNAGYTRSGSATTTCQTNGTWSAAAPTCVANACAPALANPTNGTVDFTTGVTGNVRNYTCNAGYTRSGSATTTCQTNGTWSNAAPTCVANACAPALANPANGTVDFTSGVTGDVRNYTCNAGYTRSGSATTTCQTNGTWSAAAPTCVANACAPALSNPTNGTVDFTSGVTGDTRNYSCNAGYTRSGSATTTCQANGTWSAAAPTCVANACAPALANPTNGTVDFTTGVTGNVRNYTCNAGYTRSGSATTTCQTNGTWSNAAPTCVANACAPPLSNPTNGTVDNTTGVTGDTRNYTCNAGYTRSGSATTTCQANGTWSAAAPTCVANACAPALSNPANGTVDNTTGVTGDTRNYTCNAGYTRSGSATTTCQTNGTWSAAAPTCVANACAPALSNPANGTVDNTTGVTGDTRNYTCNAGYTRSGSATTTCQANGTWSAAAPTCVANACAPPLSNPTNGTVDNTTGVTGDTRNYTCNAGYTRSGSATTTCQANGTWSAAAPTCVADACSPALANPTNGSVTGTTGTTGDSQTYSCDAGYTLSGTAVTTCQADHTWSSAPPTCLRCVTNADCPTGATCSLPSHTCVLAAPVVDYPGDASVINTQSPTITGTGPANVTITVTVDGTVIGTTTSDNTGAWSLAVPSNLALGAHTVKASASSGSGPLGVTSPDSATNNFTIITGCLLDTECGGSTPRCDVTTHGCVRCLATSDCPSPATCDVATHACVLTPPVVATPANGSTTNNTQPDISGTGPANATITVYVDGTQVGTTTSDGTGAWTFTPSSSLGLGSHTVKATATEGSGPTAVVSADSNTNTFTIISGCLVNADCTGTLFRCEVSTHTCVRCLVSSDCPGDSTTCTAQHECVLAAPTVTTPADGSITNDPTPDIRGTGPSSVDINVYVDGTLVGTTQTNGSGNWTFTPSSSLATGSHTVSAEAVAGSVTSPPSNTNTFTVVTGCVANSDCSGATPVCETTSHVCVRCLATSDCPTGATCTAQHACEVPPPVVETPADGSVTNNHRPTLSGTAEPNATVTITVDGNVVGTATTDGTGHWTLDVTSDLSDGQHTVSAVATLGTGSLAVDSARSATNTFTVVTGCVTNGDCGGSTPVCQPTTRVCVQCTGMDTHACTGDTPLCDTAAGATQNTCVGCLSSSDCPSAQPNCNLAQHRCETGCSTNSQCASPTPLCAPAGNPHAGTCVQCVTTGDCPQGNRCSDTGMCVGCLVDADCSSPTPWCNTTSHTCVECRTSPDCTTAEPVCDATSQSCRGCTSDPECPAATPACLTTGPESGQCAECATDSQCPATAAHCDTTAHLCRACTQDTQCPDPALARCDLTPHTCAACTADEQCGHFPDTPVCGGQGVCVACGPLNTAQCTGSTPHCSVQGICVECAGDGDCANGATCQAGICTGGGDAGVRDLDGDGIADDQVMSGGCGGCGAAGGELVPAGLLLMLLARRRRR